MPCRRTPWWHQTTVDLTLSDSEDEQHPAKAPRVAQQECPICFESLGAKQPAMALECCHSFCQPCIAAYIEHKASDKDATKVSCRVSLARSPVNFQSNASLC